MTYEMWCKHSQSILEEARIYNEWREKTKRKLLVEIGPKIASLEDSGYMGCGFHYNLESTFGSLIKDLCLPWQPSANWCAKVEDDRDKTLIAEVIYNDLIRQIKKAEESIPEFKRICGK